MAPNRTHFLKKAHIIVPAVMLGGFCIYYARWEHEQSKLRELYAEDPIGAPYIGRSGSREATEDIAASKPKYLVYGEPDWNHEKIVRARLQKIGITLHRVADCEVTLPLSSYVSSYNGEIKRAYSADAISAAFASDASLDEKEANQPPEPMRAKGPHGSS